MMKRVFAALLCVLLCMSMLPVYSFAAVDEGATEYDCNAGIHNLKPVERKEATCTTDGNIAYYRCDSCQGLFSDAEGQNALSAEDLILKAHHTKPDDKDIKKTPATCTSAGKVVYTCTVCNREVTETISQLKHSMTYVEGTAKTCTADGVVAHYDCSGCGGHFLDPAGETPLSVIAIPASHNLTAVPEVNATCTSAGNIAYWHCSDCEKNYSDSSASQEVDPATIPVAALGHSKVHVEAKDATCAADGNIEYWYCSRCNVIFLHENDAEAYAGETVISKTTVSHQLEKVAGQDATCTEAGSTEHWKCTVCGRLFSDAEGNSETTEAAVTINALGHSLTKTDAVAPTCNRDGNIAYWTCSRCGKLFSDAEGLTEIQQKDTVDSRMERVQAVEATCTENGNIACWKCKGCGKYFADEAGTKLLSEKEFVVPKTDHNYVGGVCTVCKAEQPDFKPSVKDGSGQITVKPGEGFTVTIDADYDTVAETLKVIINGVEIDRGYITLKPGSVVVTLDSAALSGLGAGTYDGEIQTAQGSVPIKLTVTQAYTVTFDVKGHGTAPASQTVESDKTASKPADPSASGYRFDGWYTDSACTNAYDFGSKVTKDITLYAKWTKTFTVTFNTVLPVDSVTPNSTQTVEENGKITKPADPTDAKQHHKFQGWYADAAYTTKFDFNQAIKQDTTVYAKWSHPYDEGICYYCWKANPGFSEVKDPAFVAKIVRGNGGTAHYGYYAYPFTLNTSYEYTKNSIAVKIGGFMNGSWVEVPVDPSFYDVVPGKSGGTVVSLKPGLIRMLPVGKYSIAISTNLYPTIVNGYFRVSSSPKTGDDSNVALWVTVGVFSAAAAAGVAYVLLRKRKK